MRGLIQRGHSVRLGVLRTSEYIESGRFPAPVERLDIPRIAAPAGWRRLYRWGRALHRDGFRVAQIFFNDSALMGPWPLRLAGLRVISCRRDMGYWYTPGVLAGLRMSAPAVDILLANSHAASEAACRHEWIPGRRARVIYNGLVECAEGAAYSVPPAPAMGRIGIVANIRPVKRIDDLISAFALVAAEFPGCELVVVGGGDSSGLAAHAQKLEVAGCVRFTGQVENPIPWIESFDVGVLCSESEGLSNTVLEYMRAAVPVVATNTGGNPELIQEGMTGFLVPVGDVGALAQRMAVMLGDRDRAAAWGKRGCDRARTFSVDAMISRHIDLYRALGAGETSSHSGAQCSGKLSK